MLLMRVQRSSSMFTSQEWWNLMSAATISQPVWKPWLKIQVCLEIDLLFWNLEILKYFIKNSFWYCVYPRFDVTRHVFGKIWHKAKRRWILLYWSWRNSLPVYPELSSHRATYCASRQDCLQSRILARIVHSVIRSMQNLDNLVR